MADARRPVWIAMADLFLDTDVRIWYAHMARVLADSPFSLPELRQILDNEVTPALQGNLLDIAGEWAGFDNEWVVGEIRHGLGQRHALRVNMDQAWAPVARLVELLRQAPADELEARSRAFGMLMQLFTSKHINGKELQPPAQYSLPQLEGFFRQDLWPVMIETAQRLARHNPNIYPNEEEIAANWIRFAAAFGPPE
jgi:hypothetical protein